MNSKQLETTEAEAQRYFPFGFHLSRQAWEVYTLRKLLQQAAEEAGEEPSLRVVRQIAVRLNERIRQSDIPEPKPIVFAGQLLSIGLLEDIFRLVIERYCRHEQPGVLMSGLDWTRQQLGPEPVERAIRTFVELFPPQVVCMGKQTEEEYLRGSTRDLPNSLHVAIESMLLDLATSNPAFRPYRDLFNDEELERRARYRLWVRSWESYFDNQPPLGILGKTLFRLLRSPMESNPESLDDQLGYILDNWSPILPDDIRRQLLITRGILREETRQRGPVDGTADVLLYGTGASDLNYPEWERFSADRGWMSDVVLIAKSTYVWLDQLSKHYGRSITRLDQIPDEELDQLARWGFNGLWLIGLWERSCASKEIKRIMGNPEAVASAYSLYDYTISEDLGGVSAYNDLRHRAWIRGIRLASDMVPNHVGIFSKWVLEHPDWFIQLDHPPFPGYTFNGPDLSPDERVSVYLEDGYWSRRDASVVFKRVDNWTGDTSYIYHGNDGTHMPWNDTAQLDYLKADVREAVIQTILHVARQFPIIRFDAAMTLAKKHYQRLWFPPPGEGGAIPSRAERGMTREEFERHIPEEFWREVVERVASEVPDTLLLAEAFWLMEGYFVRTLGMHRVYNSAFMNMLKMEDNGNYRTTIRNVLEFSPRILKRFVNFMNNPDEKTAVAQFGKGDKYFGVAVMMATMPGLPMFGHGQIEGLSEEYGMEYRRAYWDEQVDEEMVRRHEREIFPLLRRRYLFSGARQFAFYDFHTVDGNVNDDVFAYSNISEGERAVVIYHNAYRETAGWIHTSTSINIGQNDETIFLRKSLKQALDLNSRDSIYYVFREHRTALEYLRSGRELEQQGLYAQLHAYEYQVFMDFREIEDRDGSWAQLCQHLGGRGVPSIDKAYKELHLSPMLEVFSEAVRWETLEPLLQPVQEEGDREEASEEMAHLCESFLSQAKPFGFPAPPPEEFIESVLEMTDFLADCKVLLWEAKVSAEAMDFLLSRTSGEKKPGATFWHLPAVWAVLRPLENNRLQKTKTGKNLDEQWLEEWLLTDQVQSAFKQSGADSASACRKTQLLKAMLAFNDLLAPGTASERKIILRDLFEDTNIRDYLQVHLYEGVFWFNKERYEELMYWLLLARVAESAVNGGLENEEFSERVENTLEEMEQLIKAAASAGYQVNETLEVISPEEKSSANTPASEKIPGEEKEKEEIDERGK
jgi:glycosidase